MILLDSAIIREFRGIRKLELVFKRDNFAVCGRNGTGKSGVVDAIEFGLTGDVSRLSGEGKGEISLKAHGPHVDSRSAPEKAVVVLNVYIPSLDKTATIERNVKDPKHPKITPNSPDVVAALAYVESHPEIVLSRRELIKYVLATPGKRNEEVQALLHLDRVEEVRLALQKIANAAEKQVAPLASVAASARDGLLRALGLTELSKERVLAATNVQRALLGLSPLTDLNESTSLKDGMATSVAQQPRLAKAQSLIDVKATRDILAELSSDKITADARALQAELTALAADPLVVAGVTRENFYKTGLKLIESEACPFCDVAWKPDELKKRVDEKLKQLEEISRKRRAVETKIQVIVALGQKTKSAVDNLTRAAALATPPVPMKAASEYSAALEKLVAELVALTKLAASAQAMAAIVVLPSDLLEEITGLEKHLQTLPDPGKEVAARDWLVIAQERLEAYREAMRKQKVALTQAQLTRQVSDVYVASSDKTLSSVYAAVEKDFAALYAKVNRGDEDDFSATLVPSMGKLGFNVDFYKRGFFPPGAYHSEGHQDGMGLCLYLALMRYLQGDLFTFAVLDDVLMSVDSGHRREICTLLKKEFPKTQFVMTTHDTVWLRHMKTEGLITGKAAIQFRGWSVEQGPTQLDDRDVWTEIADYLAKNDVRSAAALLRHYLEYICAELCHRLRAPVEFRGDAQYQLGDLMPAAIMQMRSLSRSARDAANSWNQKEAVAEISKSEGAFGALAAASNAEQWQVNIAVHFNSWDNLEAKDFAPVAAAFKDLIAGFCCATCGEFLRVTPDRETREALRCECGKTMINLVKK